MAKETINRMKRQPTEWEKIRESHRAVRRLISKIYKGLIQLNSKKKKKLSIWLLNGLRNGTDIFLKKTYKW